ncbi:hypothetical protein M1116_00880 [Patescibacteria group bacterium]|nr:hypothetical protein [Patescibacteria group bacterium]
MNEKNKQFFLPVLIILWLLLAIPAIADDTTTNLQNQIDQYNQKLQALSRAKDTLANQISILNSQIDLTILKISQTEIAINTLKKDISILTEQIGKLDISLNQISNIFIQRVAENYKLQKKPPILLLISTTGFNDFYENYKYISKLQQNNRNTLLEMETVRTNYDLQKEAKVKKQQELTDLQSNLSEQQKNLDRQKLSKTTLLQLTKNDEKKYQALKAQAENELSALLRAKFVGKRFVKKGEALGLMGNSGYSFGDHLHFGLYNLREENLADWSYTNDISSFDYLKNHRLPMDDLDLPSDFFTSCHEGGSITQCRGNTKYSYLYSDHFHHGIDMVSTNKTVYAVDDGEAYFFRGDSSLGNHVKLFHSDGKMTLYLHLQ